MPRHDDKSRDTPKRANARVDAYAITPHGVLVHVSHGTPHPSFWSPLMQFLVAHAQAIRAVLVVNHGDGGPTPTQRLELKEALTHLRPKVPAALVTDSRVARALMTAILWITGRHGEAAVFSLMDLEQALDFLRLEAHERASVRQLLERLGG